MKSFKTLAMLAIAIPVTMIHGILQMLALPFTKSFREMDRQDQFEKAWKLLITLTTLLLFVWVSYRLMALLFEAISQ